MTSGETSLNKSKLRKIVKSLCNLIRNIKNGNKRGAIGDLNYIIDKSIELKYLLKAELEEDKV